ncbi:MAG TPA: sugar ABC transporter permease [Vicinamibacterales bacterium]|nr:sugar ABC transporter permease [Vicinamibacterales bacterium]
MSASPSERREAWLFVSPAIATIAAVAIIPMAWTVWESLHLHDLRMPWLGRPFVGADNYLEAFGDERFRDAMARTFAFAAASVSLELVIGLIFALAMSHALRARALIRVLVLMAWAVPTVVAALVWRFMFEGPSGVAGSLLAALGVVDAGFSWFVHPVAAWVPILLADAWKMTPFVALLLLAGLESIDPSLYDAARMDGAGAWRQFREITLPLLRPALLVAVLFRALDAFRVFDVIYVMTGGGPGTSTEPISLYTFTTLLQHLRFGYGSALSVLVFLTTFVLALLYIRLVGRNLLEAKP